MEYQLNENSLTIGPKRILLPGPVKTLLELEDLLIVLFQAPVLSHYSGRNIQAFDADGQRRWEVQTPDRHDYNPFLRIWAGPEGELMTEDWLSRQHRISLEDGGLRDVENFYEGALGVGED